jgi:hypothetical protein
MIALWFSVSFVLFYKGSSNVDMWGKWQEFEIVMPVIISSFVSLAIVLPIYLVVRFFKNRKK